MKLKIETKGIILYLLIFTVIGLVFYAENKNKSLYTNKFIDIIDNNEEYDLDEDQIKIYKDKINEEIEIAINSSILKKAYCSLGYLEFISGNYNESNTYLLKALDYKVMKKHKVSLMIYSGISKNYLAFKELDKSQEYFKKAEKLAKDMEKYNELSSMYRARAKSLINFSKGIGEAITLLEKALELEQTTKNKVDNYLFIAKLYMLSGMYDLAVTYSNDAIKMAMESKLDKKLTDGLISLGSIYYIQDKYSRAIPIYEKILNSNYLRTDDQELLIIGYIIDCYSKLENYNKADYYTKQYLEEVKKLPKVREDKELNWLYILVAEYKVAQGNVEESITYLEKAKKLYENNRASMYSNTDIWMEKVDLDIKSNQSMPYGEVLKGYKDLLNKIEDIGIQSGIKRSTIEAIIMLSEKNNDYYTSLKYTKKKLEEIEKNLNINLDTSADYSMNKFENDIINKKVNLLEIKGVISTIIIIIIIIIVVVIYLKNKEINKLNKELEVISITDPLTGLYNKRFLQNQMKGIYNKNETIHFIMMDIDYFKLYNDNYGHVNGDKVLKEVGKILKIVFKDDTVYRYGGEEFSVVSFSNRNEVIKKIKKLMKKLNDKDINHEYSLISDRITLSIGISSMKICEESDIDKIIKSSDEKLYKSKENGRNKYTI